MKKWTDRIYRRLRKWGWLQNRNTAELVTYLQHGTREQREKAVEEYYKENIRKICMIGGIALVLGGICWMLERAGAQDGIVLNRSGYGEDSTEYELAYQDEEGTQQSITVEVAAVQYAPEEREQAFQESFDYLEAAMLGENESIGEIRTDLNLLTAVPAEGISVTWKSGDEELLDRKGVVQNETLTTGQTVRLELELSYEDYTEYREYELTILPQILTEAEAQKKKVQELVEAELAEHPYEQAVCLTKEVDNKELYSTEKHVPKSAVILLLGIGAGALVWMRRKEKLKQERKRRQRRLLNQYPRLVNQLLLYMGAGSTIKGALDGILYRYETGAEADGELTGELRYMQNEMKNGVPQELAYQNLGKRIGLLPYMKLMNLLAQQVRKGSGGILDQLEQEEHAAFEQRKLRAKKYGEEAGTKLLLPMILLMILSVTIAAGPAIMNFCI